MSLNKETSLEELIKRKLNVHMKISYLFLKNESYLHSHHKQHGLSNSTHFLLLLVSDDFLNLSLLQRHQKINKILREEYDKLHALRIKALTCDEYKKNLIEY